MASQAQEWAMKRKAAVERAKQLREERKNGLTGNADDIPTFTPQVNRRPSYLDNRPADALDSALNPGGASRSQYAPNPNDIMEQPLPGNRKYNIENNSQAVNSNKVPSPGSDSLGKEMKRFPINGAIPYQQYEQQPQYQQQYQQPHQQQYQQQYNQQQYNHHQQQQQQQPQQYRSKFMQHYEQQGSNYSGNDVQGNRHMQMDGGMDKGRMDNSEDTFIQSLRGNAGSKGGKGWNDDTSTSGLFGEPKKVPTGGGAAGRSHARDSMGGREREKVVSSPPVPKRRPVPTSSSIGGDWNNDTNTDNLYNQPRAATNLTPRRDGGRSNGPTVSPRLNPPTQSSEGVVVQARSRLSLLKSKMRRSDSGVSSGDGRNDEEEMGGRNKPTILRSNSAEFDEGFNGADNGDGDGGYNYKGYPKTAPANRGAREGRREAESTREPPRRAAGGVAAGAGVVGSRHRQPAAKYEDETGPYEIPQQRGGGGGGGGMPRRQAPMSMGSMPGSNSGMGGGASEAPINPFDPANAYLAGPSTMDLGEQLECPDCGRKFNQGPYEKHVKICSKVFMQKRKQFDRLVQCVYLRSIISFFF